MPLSKYYSGHGSEVMQKMQKMTKKYGKKKAKSVFYATANKRKKHKGKVQSALRSAFINAK